METIYTIPEVAEYLKMSKAKVYDLVKREKIPYIRIERNVRIRESDLIKWLEERTRPRQDSIRSSDRRYKSSGNGRQ